MWEHEEEETTRNMLGDRLSDMYVDYILQLLLYKLRVKAKGYESVTS
jgi:hypothetical protein